MCLFKTHVNPLCWQKVVYCHIPRSRGRSVLIYLNPVRQVERGELKGRRSGKRETLGQESNFGSYMSFLYYYVCSTYPSSTPCILWGSQEGTNPSRHWAGGEVHPGQVPSESRADIQRRKTITHTLLLTGGLVNRSVFWDSGRKQRTQRTHRKPTLTHSNSTQKDQAGI